MLGFKVTAIKPAVKTENRVNVFINEKFDFSLEIAQVIDLRLKVGKLLTADELDDCRHASEFGKLYHHTLEYVLTRPHSEKEVRDHLVRRRKNRELMNRQAIKNRERSKEDRIQYKLRTKELPLYTDEDIEHTIIRLKEKGYLDDEKFAKFYLENRHLKRGISSKRLRLELVKKGIDKNLLEKVLSESPRDELEEIRKIIAKKRKKYSNEKLITYLVRQGFDFQQSKDAVCETDSQN